MTVPGCTSQTREHSGWRTLRRYDWPQSLLTTTGIVLAALVLNPESSPNPATSGRSLLYGGLVGLAALTLGVFWTDERQESGRVHPWRAARAYLVAVAPGLYLMGRVRPSSIAIVLAAAVLVALYGRGEESDFGLLATMMILVWLSLVGIGSLDATGSTTLPLVATVAAAGAVWFSRARGIVPTHLVIGTSAVIGAELLFGLRFQKLPAYMTATLWLAGIAAILALVSALDREQANEHN